MAVGEGIGLLFQVKTDGSQSVAELSKVSNQVTQTSGTVTKSFGQMGQATQGFGNILGQVATQSGAHLGALTGVVNQLGSAFSGLLNPMSLATAGIGALVTIGIQAANEQEKLIKDTIEYGSRINDLSVKTGLAAETISGLDLATKQSGTSIEALSNGVFLLQKNVETGSPKMLTLAKSFGITRDNVGDAEGTLRKFFEGISKLPTEAERNAAGAVLMGRSYKELSVFLQDTGGNIDAVIDKARKAGLVMSQETARAADRLGDSLEGLKAQGEGLRRLYAEQMFPQLEHGLDIFTAAMKRNKEMVDKWGQSAKSASISMWGLHAALGLMGVSQQDVEEAGQERRRDELIQSVTGGAEDAGRKTSRASTTLSGFSPKAPRTPKPKKEKGAEDFGLEFLKQLTSQAESAQKALNDLNNVTYAQRAAAELLDEKYKGLSQKVKDLILAEADLVDQWKAKDAAQKSLTKTTDDLTKFVTNQTEEIAKQAGGFQSSYKESEKLIDSIYRQGGSVDKLTLIYTKLNGLLLDTGQAMKALKDMKLDMPDLFSGGALGGESKGFRGDAQRALGAQILGDVGSEPPVPDFKPHISALQELKAVGMDAFGGLTQGFASMIEAWVLGQDTGPHALRKMTAAVLAAASAQAAVQAIMELAYGWAALARYDPVAATNHFTSAAIFGAVGVAAAVAGKLIAPKESGSAASGASVPSSGGRSTVSSSNPSPINVGRTVGNSTSGAPHLVVEFRTTDAHVERVFVQNWANNGKVRTIVKNDGMVAA